MFWKLLTKELKLQNIKAIVIQVGCIGLCYAEPIMGIIKPRRSQIIYGSLTPELARQIITDYLVNGDPRSDLALGYVGASSINGIPNLFELPVLKPQVRLVLHNCGLIDPENITPLFLTDWLAMV